MRPFHVGAGALVALVAAGTVPALGATETFRSPTWFFSGNNEAHDVYACDNLASPECSKRGAKTSGAGNAAERAHVFCSDGTWLDKNGFSTWTRTSSSSDYPSFNDFKLMRHAGPQKWASVPTSPGDYTTGTGGYVFKEIVCGDGSAASAGGHFFSINFTGVKRIPAKRDEGTKRLVRIKINGRLKATGTFGPSRNIGGHSPVYRQIMPIGPGQATGIVSVEEVFRTCRDAACKIKKLTSYRTTFKTVRSSGGNVRHIEDPADEEKRTLEVEGGRITRSTRPDCKGFRRGSPIVALVNAERTLSPDSPYRLSLIVRACRRSHQIRDFSKGERVRGRMGFRAPVNLGPLNPA